MGMYMYIQGFGEVRTRQSAHCFPIFIGATTPLPHPHTCLQSDPRAFIIFFLVYLRILYNVFKVGKDTDIISGFELAVKASSPKGEGFSYLYRNNSTLS